MTLLMIHLNALRAFRYNVFSDAEILVFNDIFIKTYPHVVSFVLIISHAINVGVDLSKLINEFPVLDGLDSFDKIQLAHVINICRESKNQAEAGRRLFSKTRHNKINNGKSPNDSHRIGQYLKKFGLIFGDISK